MGALTFFLMCQYWVRVILKFPRFFLDFHYGSTVSFRNKDIWRGLSFLSICSKISYKISFARDFHLKNEFYTICVSY